MVRVPAREAAWPGARAGGGGLCESLLSPYRPQAGWVKGGCSPPASPPTWAQTMGLCALRGRVVKVRGPGPGPWPWPPGGQGPGRGSAGAGRPETHSRGPRPRSTRAAAGWGAGTPGPSLSPEHPACNRGLGVPAARARPGSLAGSSLPALSPTPPFLKAPVPGRPPDSISCNIPGKCRPSQGPPTGSRAPTGP